MMNLRDRLDRIAGPDVQPSDAQASADMARGRRALRRRRTAQTVGTSAFAAAALAAAVAYGTASPAAPFPAALPSATSDSDRAVVTHLVAYQGEQPQGFTIDKVPSGWEVQGGTLASLTIAPTGARTTPSTGPSSTDSPDSNPDSFVGKIAIMLQSQDDHSTPKGTAVQVGDKPGVLNTAEGTDGGKNLWVKQPNGIWLLVQIWNASGWTQQEIVEFADGIHVEKGAEQGRG